MKMNYHLRDKNQMMVDAWEKAFEGVDNVTISHGDIFGPFGKDPDCIVSPANSFGFMDGGIDLAYSEFFGWDLQKRLQEHLRQRHNGILPVGQAVVVPTHNHRIPWMISAPTMTVPMPVDGTINAFLAFRAAINVAKGFNNKAAAMNEGLDSEVPIKTILCPGLGTAVGQMDFRLAAHQMLVAYQVCEEGRTLDFSDLIFAWSWHDVLAKGER